MHPSRRAILTLCLTVPAVSLSVSNPTSAQVPSEQGVPIQKTTHAVNLTAKLRVRAQGAAFVGTGSLSGEPFGAGRAKVRSTIKSRAPLRTSTTLTVITNKGNAVFRGNGRYVGSTFKATMKALSGAGAYRGITGANLAVTVVSRNGVEVLRMKGTVRYGATAQTP